MPLRDLVCRRLAVVVLLGAVLAVVPARAAHAATYRQNDVQKAVAAQFRGVHGGGTARAGCERAGRDTRWACRLKRPGVRSSTRFTVTVKTGGRWATTSFSFPGFSAKYALRACCLRRR